MTVSYSSDLCPQGVTLETTLEVTGCTEPECGLELLVDSVANDSVIMIIPTGYPEGLELVYTLNGEVFQEGGMAMTLPYAIGNGPWQACVQYITEDCPEGVVECVSSDDYDPDCPQEIWVGGAGCEFVLSICDFTEGEQVFWQFSDSTTAEGHFTWHTLPGERLVPGLCDLCQSHLSGHHGAVHVHRCGRLRLPGRGGCGTDVVAGQCGGLLRWFLLEMMQPDNYSILWDYGDGTSETDTVVGAPIRRVRNV